MKKIPDLSCYRNGAHDIYNNSYAFLTHLFEAVNNKTRNAVSAQVANLLRQERLQQKLSMARVAERAGLSYQMISYVERKMRNPTLDTMLRITSALGMNLGELIKRAEQTVQNELK